MLKKAAILTQFIPSRLRQQKLRWLLGISAIPLLGVAAAFGISPKTLPELVASVEVVESITLPAAEFADSAEAAHPLVLVDQVRRDDTLSSVLERMNIRSEQAVSYLRSAPDARLLTNHLRPGSSLVSRTTASGDLLELQFQLDTSRGLIVTRTPQGYEAKESALHLEEQTLVKSAEIRSSLFAASDEAGIPDQIALQLASIFSSDIDFNMDLRRGDRFSVIYEASYSNGELIKTGRILSAEFTNAGKTYDAFLYKDETGKEAYYSADGKNRQKAFLRSPLEFSRISSGFSLARLHPVLDQIRAHKGVDYAAPIGTRVRAVSDATVSFVGAQGGYGNVVILQHTNGISTVYGHLSRFAPGLHRGQKVPQGEVVAFVGMTGLATGPHLHYEFRVNGVHQDPLKVALPNATPLPAAEIASFKEHSTSQQEKLALLRGSRLASLE